MRRLPHWIFGAVGALTTLLGAPLTSIWPLTGIGFVLPLVLLWLRRGRRRIALLQLWLGVALVTGAKMLLAPRTDTSAALLPVAIPLVLMMPTLALLAGTVCQAALETGLAVLKARQGGTGAADGAA